MSFEVTSPLRFIKWLFDVLDTLKYTKKSPFNIKFYKKILLEWGSNPRKGTKKWWKHMKIWRLEFCQLSSKGQPTLVSHEDSLNHLPIYLNHLKLFENSRIFVTLLFRLGALNWKLSQILKATTCSCSTVARVLTKLQVPKKFDLRIFLRKYHQNCLGVIVSVLTILDFIDIKSSFKHKAF